MPHEDDEQEEGPSGGGSVEDLMNMLQRIAKNGGLSLGGQNLESDDPADYTRSVKIAGEIGDELLLKHAQIESFSRAMHMMLDEVRVLRAKIEVVRGEFFLMARKAYPNISEGHLHEGVGWRRFRGELFYVGWDRKERSNKKRNSE